MQKSEVVHHLRTLLSERAKAFEKAIASTRESFANDTKSSAGDKHEVGRAMVQQELDKLEEQRAKLITLQQELDRVPIDRNYDQVAFGSMVTTNTGYYFIAFGLGAIEVNGETCYAISLASPIGQVLKDKCVGDIVSFNGRKMTIQSIS